MATKTLVPAEEQYADIVSQKTGLDINVVRAWVVQESGWGTKQGFNFLNLRGSGGAFAEYGSVQQAADAVVNQLKIAPTWYGGILASIDKPPVAQIAAIAASPWDAAHYNGGKNLVNTYFSVIGGKNPNTLGTLVGQKQQNVFGAAGSAIGNVVSGGLTGWVLDLGLILLAAGLIFIGSSRLFEKETGGAKVIPI